MFRRRLAAFGILTTIVSTGATPVHPEAVNEKLQRYVAARVGEFDNIPQERRQQLGKLAAYIRDNARLNQPARLTFICTHNSRRSQLCQIWAATAATYYGVPHVEAYSGGTEVTAFNGRAVAALRRAGFAIDDPNDDAESPISRVLARRWAGVGVLFQGLSRRIESQVGFLRRDDLRSSRQIVSNGPRRVEADFAAV